MLGGLRSLCLGNVQVGVFCLCMWKKREPANIACQHYERGLLYLCKKGLKYLAGKKPPA